jgi:hypothetical protein
MMKMKGMNHAHGGSGGMASMSHGGGAHGAGTAKEIAKGAVVSGTIHTGRRLVNRLYKHPWVLIGLGFAAGYLVHKHRKAIISSTNKVVGKGKDFVLSQKENLEDIVAEHEEGKEES